LIPDRNFLITMGVLKNKITKKHYNLIFKTWFWNVIKIDAEYLF
jgi:hypothetical protein